MVHVVNAIQIDNVKPIYVQTLQHMQAYNTMSGYSSLTLIITFDLGQLYICLVINISTVLM